jgi:small conductance mechanosensitive channel
MMDILIGNVSLDNFLIFIFTFILTLVAGNVSYTLMRRLLDGRLSLRNSKLIAKVMEYAVYSAGLTAGVYYVLGLEFKAFVASLGIIGIAVAFASQQIIQNIIAGILIAVNRPIQLDDWVEISGGTGISNIKDITLTRTVLRDRSGRLYYIPNSVLISSIIINYTKSGFVEVPVSLKVPHPSDIEKIKNIIKDVANENPRILPNVHDNEKDIITRIIDLPSMKMLFKEKPDLSMFDPRIFISDLSESGVTLSIRLWIREINRKDEIISEFLEELLKKFKEEKIDIRQT